MLVVESSRFIVGVHPEPIQSRPYRLAAAADAAGPIPNPRLLLLLIPPPQPPPAPATAMRMRPIVAALLGACEWGWDPVTRRLGPWPRWIDMAPRKAALLLSLLPLLPLLW